MLRDQIATDMRDAMKARDPTRVSTLRMLMTAVKNAEVERGHDLADEEVVELASREAKRRKESMAAFEKGGRADLVEKEQAELAVLQGYLPEQLSGEELDRLVDEAIAATGAASPRDMGMVMKEVMPRVAGRADGAEVSARVRARLGP